MMNKYFCKNFLCLFISLFFIEVYFKIIITGNVFDFQLFRIFLFTVTNSLILAYIYSLFKPLINKVLILLTTLIFAIYALLEINFKNFMGNFMSFSMITGGGSMERLSDVTLTFFLNIKLYYYIIFLSFLILIVIFVWKKKWFNYEKVTLKSSLIILPTWILLSLFSFLTLNVTPENQLKSNKDLYKKPNLIDISLKEFGIQKFFLRDLIYIFGHESDNIIDLEPVVSEVPKEEDKIRTIDDSKWLGMIETEKNKVIKNLDEYYINQSITAKNDYTGVFKDKNLILIMVEALDLAAIDPVLTPTLYKMATEGWFFDNYYAPKYSCTTGESEFIALTSIVPSISVCTPFAYVNNTYSASIFNIFNNSNYTSTSYHSWTDQYYPRTKLHKNMGSTFYNAELLNINTQGGWPSDVELIEKAYEHYNQEDKFFSFLITVSMHFSYEKDGATTRKNWDKVKDLDTITPMKRYLAKAIEFDESLKTLLDNLEKDNLLDDTVIALFGDHHPYNLAFSALASRSNVDRYADLNEDLMPFIIYNSETEAKVISKTASTFDILPTIANLFDLNYDPRYYIGKDVFSDEETVVIFPNGNWITDSAIYFAAKNKYKLKKDNVSEDYISKMSRIVNNKMMASENTLNKDYFKYRFLNNDK